ncbi:BIG/ATPase V1 complex, subunit S1 [Dipodascopsis uninucleata]
MLFSTSFKSALVAFASLSSVFAFEDTSPLMLLSSKMTPEVHNHLSSVSISSAEHFHDLAKKLVSNCQADAYIVVSQPGLHASDFSATSEHTTPNLRKLFDQASTSYAVRNAHGVFDIDNLEKHIVDTWGADTVVVDAASDAFSISESKPQLVHVDFPALPVDFTRANVLAENDAMLYSIMSLLKTENYAVVYASSPISRPYISKRSPVPYVSDSASPTNTSDYYYPTGTMGYPTGSMYPTMIPEGARTDGSIFTRYQFFTPGMFMSIIASVILIIILGVALKSIASVKISYDAFEKEMGPHTLQPIKK